MKEKDQTLSGLNLVLSKNSITRMARRLEKMFSEKGVTMNHSESLDALGFIIGRQNYHGVISEMTIQDKPIKKNELMNINIGEGVAGIWDAILSYPSRDYSQVSIENGEISWSEHSEMKAIGSRKLSTEEVKNFIVDSYGSEASLAILRTGKDLSFSLLKKVESLKISFSVVICESLAMEDGEFKNEYAIGLEPFGVRKPTSLVEMGEEANCYHMMEAMLDKGIHLVMGGGAREDGLLASVCQHILTLPNERVVSYETIPKWNFESINERSTLSRSLIGKHFSSLQDVLRNAQRRSPSRIIVGEALNKELVSEVLNAANTGMAVYGKYDAASSLKNFFNKVSQSMDAQSISELIMSLGSLTFTKALTNVHGMTKLWALTMTIDEDTKLSLAQLVEDGDLKSLMEISNDIMKAEAKRVLAVLDRKILEGEYSPKARVSLCIAWGISN